MWFFFSSISSLSLILLFDHDMDTITSADVVIAISLCINQLKTFLYFLRSLCLCVSFACRFYNDEQVLQKNLALNRFSVDLPTKVLIHGYIANRYHSSIEPIKNAYLSAADVNLIVVDWSKGAYQPYDVSRQLIAQIAIRVGEILDDLIADYNLDKGSIHIVGHSLGAHIAGVVGRYFHGRLGR